MDTPRSAVVDEVPYASPDDVLDRYIRNRDSWTDPQRETVQDMLLDRSDYVDDRTGKAWRRRRVEWDSTASLKFSANQRNPRKRRRARFDRGGGRRKLSPQKQIDPWVDATLPVLNIVAVEELYVVRARQREEITDEGPTDIQADPGPKDEHKWYILPDRGRLKIDLHKFVRGERSISGRLVTDDVSVRATYVYGEDESGQVRENDSNKPSESVPGGLRDAVAALVAADIAETDQYGAIFRQDSGGDVNLSSTASALRSKAEAEIKTHRRV